MNISTGKLLICGFLRNEIANATANNNSFPIDISSVCQKFMGDISNVTIPNLSLIEVDDQIMHLCALKSLNSQNIVVSDITDTELLNICRSDVTHKLVGPNKILFAEYENGQTANISHYNTSKSIGYKVLRVSDNVNQDDVNEHPCDPMCAVANSGIYTFGSVQCIDSKRSRILTFGGIKRIGPQINNYAYHSTEFSAIKTVRSYAYTTDDDKLPSISQDVGELINGRGYMSLCNINAEMTAVIGGRQNTDHEDLFAIMDCVELFSLENNNSVMIKHLNYPRLECGSYYDLCSNEIIVFGGHDVYHSVNSHKNDTLCNTGEIYDFHKNIWTELPYSSNNKYYKYPCVWTVGGKCLFVAATKQRWNSFEVEVEWIDMRISNLRFNGKTILIQKSRRRTFNDLLTNSKSLLSEFALFVR